MSADEPEPAIRAARAGDAAARGELLERYRNYLSLLARVHLGRRLQQKFDPADVVQDVFLEAHRYFANFQGNTDRELTAWLRQILAAQMANRVRHFLGTQARDPRVECDFTAELDRSSARLDAGLFARQPSPSSAAGRREQSVRLADALARLPDDYREVLVLRHLEELTFPEVAARLGRSTDAVQKLWLRGLARLRAEFGADA